MSVFFGATILNRSTKLSSRFTLSVQPESNHAVSKQRAHNGPVCFNAASSVRTLMSNLCALLPFLTCPLTFLLFPLLPSLDPSFSSSYLLFVSAVGLIPMATSVWVHKHRGGVRVGRKRNRRRRRGRVRGGIQHAFKTWQRQSTSVWKSESNSPALIIFKEAHVDGGGFQDIGPETLYCANKNKYCRRTDKTWKKWGVINRGEGREIARRWRKYISREYNDLDECNVEDQISGGRVRKLLWLVQIGADGRSVWVSHLVGERLLSWRLNQKSFDNWKWSCSLKWPLQH